MKVIRLAVLVVALLAGTALAAEADLRYGAIGITDGRARALMAVFVSLLSVVVGGLALTRFAGRTGNGVVRSVAVVAMVVALTGITLGVVHLGTSTGGFGTGSGRAGAIVALLLGFIGLNLGGLALTRPRHVTTGDRSVSTRDPLVTPESEIAPE